MPEEMKVGCARPVGATAGDAPEAGAEEAEEAAAPEKEETTMIRVGQKAPDFTAPAYHQGKFIETKLSDYEGKWVALCFYPGDFTFV